ncbi:HEAT repeat domain-containing protein [Streptomyces sp. AK010]|uniref:HEAT repeat domain-containing protein n=1 Tax=Streptomyces sp. AK010 TaxID=2723074 RepID=UPI0017C3C299|nr:HEAT repeat domain-containing protein [Streptomyces sp. AK010]MBB6415541.1 hypothetical protein [Streptomyces sp. AK010]
MERRVEAVRRSDPDEVRALLEDGADPDTLADGPAGPLPGRGCVRHTGRRGAARGRCRPPAPAAGRDTLERSEDGRSQVTPEGLTTVLTLAGDEDPGVREAACRRLGHYRGSEPGVGDALVALTRDERQEIRIDAVSGLAYRDDPRCVEAEHRIGPRDPGLPFDERLMDVWRYPRGREAADGG